MYEVIAVVNGIVWTLFNLGGLSFLGYVLWLFISDMAWAQAQYVQKEDTESYIEMRITRIDALKAMTLFCSQIVGLLIGTLFLYAVISDDMSTSQSGNVLRSLVSPLGVIFIEGCIVFVGYLMIKKRRIPEEADKEYLPAN